MSPIALLLAIVAAVPSTTGFSDQRTTKGAPAPKSPRQEAYEWFTSDAENAGTHLVSSGREQVTAFGTNVKDQPELTDRLARIVAPAAMARADGFTVTTTANSVTFARGTAPAIQYTFEPDSTAGDYALVPLGIRSGTQTARGSIELVRENGVWRVAAADLGPSARWPRFDSPSFVPEVADAYDGLVRVRRARALPVQARAIALTVNSAEEIFRTVNGGFYAPLECLTDPKSCLPTYKESEPPLTKAPSLASYTPTFIAGPAPSAAEIARAKASRRSVKTFAFVMVPTSDDLPAFCSDSKGGVCEMPKGTTVTTPFCPATCK